MNISIRRMSMLNGLKVNLQRSAIKAIPSYQYIYHYFSTDSLQSPKDPLASIANHSNSSAAPVFALESHPKLIRVPSLPYVGSIPFIPLYKNLPVFNLESQRQWQLALRKEFGDFYTIGVPGFGEGSHGTLYYISDPREYVKVIRHEGTYPSGLIQSLWPMKRYPVENNEPIARGDDHGFFGRGHDWKTYRNFLQADLLSPQSAQAYIPGVILAAELASKGAPASADNLNEYLNRCAFDMFCSVMFGELVQVSDINTPTDPENLEFVHSAATYLTLDARLLFDLRETLLGNSLNIKTKKYNEFVDSARKLTAISKQKIVRFREKYDSGQLNELEKKSYLASAIRRQKNQPTNLDSKDYVTEELMIALCTAVLGASVDTTSGVIGWALVHIALNPEIQEKLYQELNANLTSRNTGRLTSDVLNKRSTTPYLHAVLRESHRVTPAMLVSIAKQITSEVEIHGVKIPANSKLAFNTYPIQMDPNYMDDPEQFCPERWLPEAVEARKGTPKELMDHPFFKDPFSQGARKCPGSRVAMNEILVFLSQLILDYKIRAPAEIRSYDDVPYTQMGTLTPVFPRLEFIPRNVRGG